MLLAAAQVHRVVVAILDMQSNGILVELAAGIQIHYVKNNMAAADDVEGRIEDVLRDGHTKSLLSKSLARLGEEIAFRQRALRMRVLRAAGFCAFPAQARHAWFPCRNRTNNRRRRGQCPMTSCRRTGSASAARS